LDRSSFGCKARPAGFDGKARSAERLLAPDFKSARISMAHQKVPAVPQIAMTARMAVNREAPNKVIAAIRRCSPYCALCRAFIAPPRPGIPAKAHIRRTTTKNTRCRHFCVAPLRQKFDQMQPFGTAVPTPKDGAPSARDYASLDGVRIVLQAWSARSRKSDVGLIPIKLGVASGQQAMQVFRRAKFFLRQCVGVVERGVSP
jgi:hypothetical protein